MSRLVRKILNSSDYYAYRETTVGLEEIGRFATRAEAARAVSFSKWKDAFYKAAASAGLMEGDAWPDATLARFHGAGVLPEAAFATLTFGGDE